MLDLGEAAGIEPVITTTAQSTASHPAGPGGSPALPACCAPEDMADLIEYCWGNASTTWGQRRIEDGHIAPYKLRYIELGNGKPSSRTASIRAVSGSASISICMCVCVCLSVYISLIFASPYNTQSNRAVQQPICGSSHGHGSASEIDREAILLQLYLPQVSTL